MTKFIQVCTHERGEFVDIGPQLRELLGEVEFTEGGDLLPGTWQRVFLAEWDAPRTRRVAAKFSS